MEQTEGNKTIFSEQEAAKALQLLSPVGNSDASGTVPHDEFGLPFEPLDRLAEQPPEFEEMAAALWEDAQDLYIQTAVYNRFSPHYLTLCSRLEAILKRMGSFCITKAVLEQKGYEFPELAEMKIWNLYCMSAYNFRKCHEAYQSLKNEGKGLDLSLLDWEFRWYGLAERLKATEDRICRIRSGEIKADDLLERAEIFRGDPVQKKTVTPKEEKPASVRKALSFPVIRSYAGTFRERKKAADREHRKVMKQLGGAFREPEIFKPVPINDPVKFEKYIRKEMLEDARARGDRQAVSEIRNENSEELMERFRREVNGKKETSAVRTQAPPGAGPSDEVRKKLREKRKKRKK